MPSQYAEPGLYRPARRRIGRLEYQRPSEWDSRKDEENYICVQKKFVMPDATYEYTVRVFRPVRVDPLAMDAMGVDEPQDYIEIFYFLTASPVKKDREVRSPNVLLLDLQGKVVETIDRVSSQKAKEVDPTKKDLVRILYRVNHILVLDSGLISGQIIPLSSDSLNEVTVLADIKDEEQIIKLRSIMGIIDDPETLFHCMCVGSPTFILYHNEEILARISLHHGRSIRCDRWTCDAILENDVSVLDWLAENDVKAPKEKYENDLRYRKEERLKEEAWLNAAPECVRPIIESVNWSMASQFPPEKIVKAWREMCSTYPDVRQRALVLFEWYGLGLGPWNSFSVQEGMPNELLLHISTEELIKYVDDSLTEIQMEGASRYFSSGNFNEKKYKDRKLLSEDLKKRIYDHVKKQNDEYKVSVVKYYLFK